MVLLTAPALPADLHTLPTLAPTATVATAPATPTQGWVEYRVKGGDTLIGIAAIHRTTAGALAARNGISDPRTLRAGATILVPSGSAPTPTPSTDPATAPTDSTPTSGEAAATAGSAAYTVRAGDSPWSIATAHGVTVPALLKANGLSTTSFVHPGQVLTIPGGTTASPAAAKPAPTPAAPVTDGTATSFAGIDGVPTATSSPAANRALLATATVPSRMTTRDLIVATANQHGVDPQLALAIGMQESGWNQRMVSHANAIGVMQVIPAGGDWAEDILGRDLNLMDTRDNITAGVVMLRALGRMTGSEQQAIAAYYQGLTSVRTRGWYADTHSYVANVLALKSRV